MPVVPSGRQSQFRVVGGDEPQIEPKFLAMAAAMMHEQGRLFQPVGTSEMGAISRFGRPNVKAGVPTADNLKREQSRMEKDQIKSDTTTDEAAPIERITAQGT